MAVVWLTVSTLVPISYISNLVMYGLLANNCYPYVAFVVVFLFFWGGEKFFCDACSINNWKGKILIK